MHHDTYMYTVYCTQKIYTVHLPYIFSYCISGICRSWDCPSFCENDGGSGIDCPFLALFQTFHSEGNGPLSEEAYGAFSKGKIDWSAWQLESWIKSQTNLDNHLSLDVFGSFVKGLLTSNPCSSCMLVKAGLFTLLYSENRWPCPDAFQLITFKSSSIMSQYQRQFSLGEFTPFPLLRLQLGIEKGARPAEISDRSATQASS